MEFVFQRKVFLLEWCNADFACHLHPVLRGVVLKENRDFIIFFPQYQKGWEGLCTVAGGL